MKFYLFNSLKSKEEGFIFFLTMKSKCKIFLFLIIILMFALYLLPSLKTSAQTPSVSNAPPKKETERPGPYSTLVTATVPYFWWLELSGWTSPYAQVELSMEQIIKRLTTADSNGQFVFRIALPRTLAPFCLIATDVSNISSSPLCLPPPPPEFNILIKEVVMPPTLKIDKGKIAKGETVSAQGYTTPNSEVIPYFFEEKPKSFLQKIPFFRIPKSVNATSLESPKSSLPKPLVKSNQNGFYQFNLPTSNTGEGRIFVGSILLNNPSPKSTTLFFNVLSPWIIILEKFMTYYLWLINLILEFLTTPEGIIISELLLIIIIIFLLTPKRKTQTA